MKDSIEAYLEHLLSVRRYSRRTVEIYRDALERFCDFLKEETGAEPSFDRFDSTAVRSWEVRLLDDGGMSPTTVNLHISALSGYARYLVKKGVLKSNPISSVSRPKQPKRLPSFFRRQEMLDYLERTKAYADGTMLELYSDCQPLAVKADKHLSQVYGSVRDRMIVSLLYGTGIRRSELISLKIKDVDFSRSSLRVRGKGDKVRDVPVVADLLAEIRNYLDCVRLMVIPERDPEDALIVTASGAPVYPVLVDKAVKGELGGGSGGVKGRKSPHVLRHTLATELLEDGTDLNSIKEVLGHSSLAATQVYTHNSIAQLKKVYGAAHPRAKEKKN